MVFISLFLQIGSDIACKTTPEVCDWKENTVGLKTNNMIASGILIVEGVIITFGKNAQSIVFVSRVDTHAFTRIIVRCNVAGSDILPHQHSRAANRLVTTSTNQKMRYLAWEKITALALMFASIEMTVTALAAQ